MVLSWRGPCLQVPMTGQLSTNATTAPVGCSAAGPSSVQGNTSFYSCTSTVPLQVGHRQTRTLLHVELGMTPCRARVWRVKRHSLARSSAAALTLAGLLPVHTVLL